MDFLPLGAGGGAAGFPAENDQGAAQGHAGREKAGEKAGEVFQVLAVTLVDWVKAKPSGPAEPPGGAGPAAAAFGSTLGGLARGLFRQAYGLESAFGHLFERVLTVGGLNLAAATFPSVWRALY